MTREQYIESKREALRKSEIMCDIIELLEERRMWDMDILRDENGEFLKDEDGEYMRVKPNKDNNEWGYYRYEAFTDVIALIEKTYFK